MIRALFLADGSSDMPLAGIIERLCHAHGAVIDVVPVPHNRLPDHTAHTVKARVEAALRIDDRFGIVFIHRDAERQSVASRKVEVEEGVAAAGFDGPSVAVVPVRMTEAWLLLDELAIRTVAGRPSGTNNLHLPIGDAVERIPDPKGRLSEVLCEASGATGRRRKLVRKRFPEHRRLLLERLDHRGPVSTLPAWRSLTVDLAEALTMLEF